MPRRGHIAEREVLPDPIYNSPLVTSFVNKLMLDGKRGTAETIMYGALDIVAEKTGKDALQILETAVKNVMPILEVKPRRVGGATYQVPVEVRAKRRNALAFRWLVTYSRARGEKTMVEKLAGEIMDAANNTGASIKKREDVHKMADANKAFAHYRY
jgi:small subunit ribosomal protein S7